MAESCSRVSDFSGRLFRLPLAPQVSMNAQFPRYFLALSRASLVAAHLPSQRVPLLVDSKVLNNPVFEAGRDGAYLRTAELTSNTARRSRSITRRRPRRRRGAPNFHRRSPRSLAASRFRRRRIGDRFRDDDAISSDRGDDLRLSSVDDQRFTLLTLSISLQRKRGQLSRRS